MGHDFAGFIMNQNILQRHAIFTDGDNLKAECFGIQPYTFFVIDTECQWAAVLEYQSWLRGILFILDVIKNTIVVDRAVLIDFNERGPFVLMSPLQ